MRRNWNISVERDLLLDRALSESVIADLIIPNGWHAAAEYQQEFGGLYPVQVRFGLPMAV
ncbi:conjugation system SOS inhibitor PsiB family protein [Pseudocitrobacter faecalis]|uniref:conjugation system SOS inhibitor PsiB family protein n=1 Tax=Pseudocitrobacter faecalis TaxID=1398493 RepID=UPI004062E6DF